MELYLIYIFSGKDVDSRAWLRIFILIQFSIHMSSAVEGQWHGCKENVKRLSSRKSCLLSFSTSPGKRQYRHYRISYLFFIWLQKVIILFYYPNVIFAFMIYNLFMDLISPGVCDVVIMAAFWRMENWRHWPFFPMRMNFIHFFSFVTLFLSIFSFWP